MLPAGFEPTVLASERLQTHALDRAAIGTGRLHYISELFITRRLCFVRSVTFPTVILVKLCFP